MKKSQFLTKPSFVLFVSCALSAVMAQPSDYEQKAKQILDTTGIKGGLIVHIGCGDGKLTAALRVSDSYLVHGLDSDADKVHQARQYVRSLGIYGNVAVDLFDGKRLPYVDNLVNLVVTEDLDGISAEEVMRVLCPNGVVYVKEDDKWKTTVKPWPKQIDEWTHYLHDDGKTWPHIRLISDDRPDREDQTKDAKQCTIGFTSAEPEGYMYACQGANGLVHVISSWNYYVFNLKWLQTPPPAKPVLSIR